MEWTYDKVADYHFEAWIGSYGNYNAGILKGDWLKFPVKEETLDSFLSDVVGINEFNEEVMINDYDGNLFDLDEDEDPYMINTAAMIWESLEDYDKFKVVACYENNGFMTLEERCNAILQVDRIGFFSYDLYGFDEDYMKIMSNEEKMGYSWANITGLYKQLEDLGAMVLSHFDFEGYGEDIAQDCILYDEGYYDASYGDPDLDFYDRKEIKEYAEEMFQKNKDREKE